VRSYAAFLRGINLGPTRKISSAELRSTLEGIGFDEVATFRNSGNVVFDAGGGSPAKLGALIEAALEESTGFEVGVFLRDADEVRAIAAHRPFEPALVEGSAGKLQVALLAGQPEDTDREAVLGMATDEDRLAFGERELYWLPSGGMRDAALSFSEVEKRLGSTTMRTKGTIEQLAAKYFAPG